MDERVNEFVDFTKRFYYFRNLSELLEVSHGSATPQFHIMKNAPLEASSDIGKDLICT